MERLIRSQMLNAAETVSSLFPDHRLAGLQLCYLVASVPGAEGQTASPYGLESCDVQGWTAQWEAVNHTWTYDPDNGDPVETYSAQTK